MNSTDVAVNGYVIVIKNDQNVSLAGSGIVESFKCKTSSQGAVPDYRNGLVAKSKHLCRFRKSKSS